MHPDPRSRVAVAATRTNMTAEVVVRMDSVVGVYFLIWSNMTFQAASTFSGLTTA